MLSVRWMVFVVCCVVCVTANDLCLFYSIDDTNINTNVQLCSFAGPFEGFVQIQPYDYRYYVLTNYNNTELTKYFISDIAPYSDYIICSTSTSVLVSVKLEHDDEFIANLPSGAEILAISPRPQLKIEKEKLEALRELAERAKAPNPVIQALVNQVNSNDLKNFVSYLSGELSGSPITTRNSISNGAVLAADWLVKQFTSFGFQTSTQCFRSGYSCNVIAQRLGSTKPREFVIVGAHYDSRASDLNSPTQRAPGANDDGSGTGTLLQIAKIFSTQNAKFARSIRLVAFSGEEQGLLGSQAYAESLVTNKTNVFAMVQNDMIAYRATGTGELCGFPLRYTTPELTELAIATANLYSPTLTTGRNDRCCSDHRSFYERGFPATDFSDTLGPIVDPEYHKSGDLVDRPGFDFPKYSAIVKGILATTAVLAEPV